MEPGSFVIGEERELQLEFASTTTKREQDGHRWWLRRSDRCCL